MSAAAALLQASSLARHYSVSRGPLRPRAIVRALDGVSFSLASGQTLGVVGESGCGKSTLARLVTMIETPSAGELRLCGVDMALAERSARKRARPLVQMVFQNPYASLNPRKKIGAMLEEPLALNTALARPERRARAEQMLARVGLGSEHIHRYAHMFSGGQRQRIAIARALVAGPKVVVADEAVSALDVSVQGQILNLLADLQQDTGVAYLFISHNLSAVEFLAHSLIVMYLGKVVESGSKRAMFACPSHPYTRALMASMPRIERAGRRLRAAVSGEPPSALTPPSGCAFHPRCPYANARCKAETPLLAATPAGTWAACHGVEEGRIAAEPLRSPG